MTRNPCSLPQKAAVFAAIFFTTLFTFPAADAQVVTDTIPGAGDPCYGLKLRIEKTDVTKCHPNDGKATIIVSGGTKPYTCWLATHTGEVRVPGEGYTYIFEKRGLSKGNYYFVVRDANWPGCQADGQVRIKMDTKVTCVDTAVNKK